MAAAATFESGHADMVHDAQFDYYGRRLATCSSDRTIKVFELSGEHRQQIADLHGHEGPVWQVSWAHPRYGALLASCSFDHRVIIWKEGADGQWLQVRGDAACCALSRDRGCLLSSCCHDRSRRGGPHGVERGRRGIDRAMR